MKKLWLLLVLLLPCCGPIKSENAIAGINNLDSVSPIDISFNQYANLMDSKSSFSLFLYQENCYSCENAKETIEKYNKDKNQLLYSLCVDNNIKESLIKKYPNIYNSSFTCPAVIIFKEGILSLLINGEKLNKESNFSASYTTNIIDTNIMFSQDKEIDATFNSKPFVFKYNLNNIKSLEYLNTYLYPLAVKSQKNTLLIEGSDSFCAYFDKKVVNYLDNLEEFKEILNVFFAD